MDLRRLRIDLDRSLVERGGLREFIRLSWPIVEPSRPYLCNWHIDAIADHLQAVSQNEIRDLVINVPPGTGKSRIVSVLWHAWEWSQRQGTRFIYASYDLGLPRRDGTFALELMTSEWFQDRWGRVVDPEQPVLEYYSEAGGMRYGTSVLGKVTGNHADISVIDDPLKPLEATKRGLERCIEWNDGTMPTRMADPKTVRRVIIMQRIHYRDLAGHILESTPGVVHLCLPMRFESRAKCVTSLFEDPRTTDGELLHPARFDAAAVERLEARLGPLNSAAQLQQRPTPAGGNIFALSWLGQEYDKLPLDIDQWCMSVDATFKKTDSSDFVCIQVWARSKTAFYLVDLINERMSFTDTLIRIREMSSRWPRCLVKLVEDAANGAAVADVLKKEILGIELVKPQGGKEARANAVTSLFRGMNIWLPRNASWLRDYRNQMITFPLGVNDDMVDSTTQALTWMSENMSNLARQMAAIRDRWSKGT